MGRTEQSKTARENCSTLFQHRESGNGKAGLERISVVFLFLHKCLKFIIGLVFFSLTIAKRAACFTVRSLFILRRQQEREMASCSVWSIRFGRDRSVSELNKTFETILVLHLVFVSTISRETTKLRDRWMQVRQDLRPCARRDARLREL